jgi:glycosyltransferase involved in cell wall biosynthesis
MHGGFLTTGAIKQKRCKEKDDRLSELARMGQVIATPNKVPQGRRTGEGHAEAPLHIAFYSPALPESGLSNGIVTYSRIMREALRALGHSVIVVTAEHIQFADGRIAELPKPSRLSGRVRAWLESRRPEDGSHPWGRLHVINAFHAARQAGAQVFEMEESFGWAGRLTGNGVAIVERLHGPHVFGREEVESPTERRMGDLREAAERASFLRVEAITSPTEGLLRALIERYGLNLRTMRAVLNPMPVAPPAVAWNIENANPDQILCIGRFDLRKGADIVLQAFARASQLRPSMSLIMVGPDTGLAQANGSRIHFDDYVRSELCPEVRSRIRFLGSQLPGEIAELRRQSQVAVVGARFESFAYSIAEAMAAGMPVLTSDNFGGLELIRDGIDGRVVATGDIPATASALLQMVGHPERLSEMGRSAYARASEILAPERIARETVEVYRQAIALI